MGLLDEIIEGARGSVLSTTELLRSVRVLAVRGRAQDLGDWVKRELAGYPKGEPLPRYRGPFDTQALGRFSGPMGSAMTIAIPDLGFPKDFDPLFKIELRGPLSELEGMLDADFDKQMGFAWPANAVAWANQLMDQGKVAHVEFHVLSSVHRPLAKNLLLTVINGVRDRILDLALELEQVSPELEHVESGGTAVQPEKMSAVYQVVVHADNAFVGENTTEFQHLQITPGDPDSLDRYLEGLGIGDAAQRRELVQHAEDAKAQDGPVKTARSSPRSTRWQRQCRCARKCCHTAREPARPLAGPTARTSVPWPWVDPSHESDCSALDLGAGVASRAADFGVRRR